MPGIDGDLDALRASGAELSSALSRGIDFLKMDGGVGETRQSESKSRFVQWDVSAPAPRAVASTWSEAIPVSKEHMTTKDWISEMELASRKIWDSYNLMNSTAAAGIAPPEKKNNPSFFAWALEGPAATESIEEEQWERHGDGWKSKDGVFYSDKDLINDVLQEMDETALANLNFEEQTTEVSAEQVYSTENASKYVWPKEQPETTSFKPSSESAAANLGIDTTDNGELWQSEYASSCAEALTFDTNAPTAGVSSASTGGPIPMAFSWSRIKPEQQPRSPMKVIIGAPYGTTTKAPASSWVTEYDDKFVEQDTNEPVVEEVESVEGEIPYGTMANEVWSTEYDSAYLSPDAVVEEAVQEEKVEEVVLTEDTDEVNLVEAPVEESSGNSLPTFNIISNEVTHAPKAKKSLRFITEYDRSYKWDKDTKGSSPVKKCAVSTKIHYTNEEAAEGVMPKLKVYNKCDDWYKMTSVEGLGNDPINSEYRSQYTPKDPEDGPEPTEGTGLDCCDCCDCCGKEECCDEDGCCDDAKEECCIPSPPKAKEVQKSNSYDWYRFSEDIIPSVPMISEMKLQYTKPEAVEDESTLAADEPIYVAIDDSVNAVDSLGEIADIAEEEAAKPPAFIIKGKALTSPTTYRPPSISRKAKAKKATNDASRGAKKNSKKSKGGVNPLLKNVRYPHQSGSTNTWKSESASQFVRKR